MDKEKSAKTITNRRASENVTSIDCTTSLSPNTELIIQNFRLIWLDANYDKTNPDYQQSIKALRRIVISINTFTDAQECIDFLSKVKEEKVFVIVSGSLGQRIVPNMKSLSQVESIYVFCSNKAAHEKWTKEVSKVKGVYSDIDSLCQALISDQQTCERNMIPIRFNRIDSIFMYTQLLKDAIMQIEDDEDQQIKNLVSFCQEQGGIKANEIKQIRTEYRQHPSIWWYTGDTFMYSMLNRGLREMNTDIILNMQFFIRHLHQHIAELYTEQKQTQCIQTTKGRFTVYRGQALSTDVFEQLKQSKGELMSFNNFLSTSLNPSVSLWFANQTSSDSVAILFVMDIDTGIAESSNIPYADVSKVSYYKGKEAEILFTTHTIFRINSIQRIADGGSERIQEVQLTLAGNDDEEFTELMAHFKSEINGEGWERVGMILIKMGESRKAEQLYETLLARATTESEQAAQLHQLGWVYKDRGEYSKAIEFYKRSLEIHKKILDAHDPNLASSYNSIGIVYYCLGKYSKAFKYYQKSLEIRKIALSSNDSDLAMSYNDIGNVYSRMSEYSKALESHQKSLEIMKIARPRNHPDLAQSYMNIGSVYSNMGEYSKALEYYQKSLGIMKKALPPNHPDLAAFYNNIGFVYMNIDEYSKALESYQKSFNIMKIALSSNHPSLASSYNNIGLVYEKMGEYPNALEYYQKSLEIKKEALPSNHPSLAGSYNNIGSVYNNMGNYSKALEYYQKSFEIKKITLSPNDPDLASSYNNIGAAYESLKNYQKALSYYRNAEEIWQKSLPSSHPHMATVKRNIEITKTKV